MESDITIYFSIFNIAFQGLKMKFKNFERLRIDRPHAIIGPWFMVNAGYRKRGI